MRIYTEVNFQWDDKKGKLVEVSSESFDYNGEMSLLKAGDWETWKTRWYDDAGNVYKMKVRVGDRKVYDSRISKSTDGGATWQDDWKKSGTNRGKDEAHGWFKSIIGLYGVGTEQHPSQPGFGVVSGVHGTQGSDDGGAGWIRAFQKKYGFDPNMEDTSANETFLAGVSDTDYDEEGAFIGTRPDWAPEDGREGKDKKVEVATTFDDPFVELADLEGFDPSAIGPIAQKLKEFGAIITEGKDDIYENEVIKAVEDLNLGLEEAQEAFTKFGTDLGTKWGQYLKDVVGIEKEWAVGDTWDDKNKDGIVDAGELTESDGIEGLTPPGRHVQEAFKKYGVAEDPLAIAKEAALTDLTKRLGDPFVDENNNNIWDPGETWGKEWADKDGDNKITADELTGAVAGEEPATGTEVGKTQKDYTEGYRSIFGSASEWKTHGEDTGYTHEKALEYGIIYETTGDDGEGTGKFKFAGSEKDAPSPEDWVEGSYYREKRLAGETADIGYKAHKTTREGALESLRTEAKEKIRSADAKRGAAGFAATSVGGTARDALAREIGKEARDIEKAHTEGRDLIRITHEEDIKSAETAKRIGTTDPGGIEDVRDTLLEKYYDENKTSRESAVSGYKTSEAGLALTRDQALVDAAEKMDPKLGLIPQAQAGVEAAAVGFEETWKGESRKYRDMLKEYGASGTTPEEYTKRFEITGSKDYSIRERAEARLSELAGQIEDLLVPMQVKTLPGGEESPFFISEDFNLWTDPTSPFKGGRYEVGPENLPWTTHPGGGFFGEAGEIDVTRGMFDPGDKGFYDPGSFGAPPNLKQPTFPTTGATPTGPTSWLYQPGDWGGFEMPWEQEDYTGIWDPYGE